MIAAALGAIAPELTDSVRRVERSRLEDVAYLGSLSSENWVDVQNITRLEFEQAVLALDVFPRCALLLTVFERLSIRDTAILVGADEAMVRKARRLGLIDLTRNIGRGRDVNSDYDAAVQLGGLQQA